MREIDSEDGSAQKDRNQEVAYTVIASGGRLCSIYMLRGSSSRRTVYGIEISIPTVILMVPLSKVRAMKTTHFNISYLLPVF